MAPQLIVPSARNATIATMVSASDASDASDELPQDNIAPNVECQELPLASAPREPARISGSNARRRRQSEFSCGWRDWRATQRRQRSEQRASDVALAERDRVDRASPPPPEPLPELVEAPIPSKPVTISPHRSRRASLADYSGSREDGGWQDEIWDAGWATRFRRPAASQVRDDIDVSDHDIDPEISASSHGAPAQTRLAPTVVQRGASPRIMSRRRPVAVAIFALFVLGFALTCVVPLIPVLRLSYDAADAVHRITALKALVAADPTRLMNASVLRDAQSQVHEIQRDLYEINGTINVVGAPLSALSPSARNYRLLVGMGLDLTQAAAGGMQAAQAMLTPIMSGGILNSSATSAGITPADIQQARVALANAHTHLLDAYDAYGQLDQQAMPDQFKPGTTAGKLLAMMPAALSAVDELNSLLDVAPALLGVGQPAYYLIAAMDSTELRPGGGFIGNYGILALDGGKQVKGMPLSLRNTYPLDQQYYQNALQPYRIAQHVKSVADVKGCASLGPQAPAYYWWWPYRDFDTTCKYGWGLRDANLSASFPDNARAMMQIVEDAGGVTPNGAPLQGVIAFTPGLIKGLIAITGPIEVPQFNVTVNADNLETMIHTYQLTDAQPKTGDRKAFTHQLSAAMLDKLKTVHGSALKAVIKVGEEALKSKDLQVYFSEPRAELALSQLGFSSDLRTGGGDGFMVVDANDGGNKANAYVTEKQTDLVTLLPNGGAIHRLQIVVTYNKGRNSVYPGNTGQDDYSDFQRTYLPSDAIILGMSGYNPNTFAPSSCDGSGVRGYGSIITDCSPQYAIINPVTTSDIPGRAMVGGALLVLCGRYDTFTNTDHEYRSCETEPEAHTQTIYISWYTQNAFTPRADGHGSYAEVVEHQAGNSQALTVYVDTSQLRATQERVGATTPDYTIQGDTSAARDAAFAALLNKVTVVYNGPLIQDLTVAYKF